MKIFDSSRAHSYFFALVVAGLSTAFITTTFGKKSDDEVSPVKPKVTLCHKGNTISVAEASVQAHLDHGDTLGPCPSSLGANAAPSKLDSPPPSGSVSSPSVAPTVVATAPAAPKAPSAPVVSAPVPAPAPTVTIPAPPALPSVTPSLAAPVRPAIIAPPTAPTTPVLDGDEVTVCYKGNTLKISRSSIQDYLDLGATLGRCPESQ